MKFIFIFIFLITSAFGQHVKQLSPNGGGSLSDALVSTPDHEAQLGIAYYGNKVFHILASGTNTIGDWKHSFVFPTGIQSIGDADFSGLDAVNLSLQLNGNSANWNLPGDAVVTSLNWSTNDHSSGSGYNVAVMQAGLGIFSVTLVDGGNGYTVGDLLSIDGGTLAGVKGALRVATTSSGIITSIILHASGEYLVAPTNPTSVSPITGSGSGATFNLTLIPKGVHAWSDNSLSFMHVPANRIAGLIPGWGMIVSNRDAIHNKGFAFCAPGLAGFDTGNYSVSMNDYLNRKFRIPKWVANCYQPSDAGWQDTFIADPATGIVTIPGSLQSATITNLQNEIDILAARIDALLLKLKAAGTE